MATEDLTIGDLEDEVDLVDLDDWDDDEDAPDHYDSGYDEDAGYYFDQAARAASWTDDGWLDA